MIYKMTLKDSVDTMTFNLLETPIVDKDIEGAVDNVTLDGNQYTDYLYLKKQYIQKWAIMCPDEYDELRGFYTRQFEEGEVPSYRVYYGANVTRDYTLNGDYLQFNAEGIETGMTLSQLLGNAEQQTYSGKNLLPPTADWTQTVSGVTITCSNGQYTFSGTSTANGSTTARATVAQYTIQAGDYFHYCNSLASPNINIQLIFTDNTSFATSMNVTNRVFPIDNYNGTSYVGKTISSCRVNFASGFAFNGTASPMILHNVSTVADYEPYVGGIPSPNPDYPQTIETVTGEQTVRVTGKNLVEDTISGSSIDGNGIIRSNSDFDTQVAFVMEGETYTLSYTGGTVVGGYFATKPTMNSVSIDGIRIVNNNKTFVAQYTGYFTFRTNAGESNAQCELGSTATAYEPYQGQSYEVNLGKNLFDKDNANILGGYIGGGNPHTISMDGSNTSIYIPCQPNTTYTISKVADNVFRAGTIAETPASGVVVNDYVDNASGTSITLTSSSNAKYIVVFLRNASSSHTQADLLASLQIERGSTATTYAPYFTPIELAKIGDYQDYIWNDEGTWKIHKSTAVAVLNGTENWAESGTTHERFVIGSAQTTFSLLAIGTPSYKSKCDYFKFQEGGTAWTGIGRCGFDGLGTFWCMISGMSSLADFKAWLGANNVRVYYPLATPTDTEITDETLLSQLNFLASLYKGENNISLVGTGAQGEMEVFIRDVMSVETDVVPEVSVRLTLTDDGVINACGCRRNVQLTMRETTE